MFTKFLSHLSWVAWVLFCGVFGLPVTAAAAQPGGSPVKIFILAGQSNMVGMGFVGPVTTPGTLEYLIANDPDYAFLGNGVGGIKVLNDVWIQYETIGGNLTSGFGGSTTMVGPELGFGHAVGQLYGEQVLLIKYARGGRSLGKDFLPPSSGPYPAPVADGDTGYHYHNILALVSQVTSNLATYFPSYDGGGYEIAGFCWHQGWNDRIDTNFSAAYETNMANFINDIRSDLGTPNLPFVIATSGMDPWIRRTQVEQAQLAMANPVAHPSFAGNVAVIDTRLPYEGLTFWQLSSESPQDEGYHWNRNAKTYTNIGLAMADAMSLMVPPSCPYRLKASGNAAGVTLSWENGTDAATSVQVMRNGAEIAAAAGVSPATFLDATAVPGVIEYQLNFTMAGDPCPPLTLSFDAGITGLEAHRVQNTVKLTWTNNLGYTNIEVRRDAALIATLPGTDTSFIDATPPGSGTSTYSVVPTHGSAAPTQVSINLDGLSPGNSYVYEPFADSDAKLNENVAGPGLAGRWIGGLNVAAGSLSYGPLPTSANQGFNSGGGNTSAGAVLRPELAAAGLLDDGAVLWFSFLTNNTAGVNTAAWFCLGTDRSSFFTGMEDGGQGIGVNINQGSQPKAATWAPGRSEGSTTGSIASDTTALVVGKITWGANSTAADTVEIYLPGTDLALPATPVSTKTAVLNQSQFKVLSMGGKNASSPRIDEIRLADSYNDVIAVDLMVADEHPPTPNPMTWASPPAADSDSSISMTATTASDPAGVEYYFTNQTVGDGSHDSGWQDSPSYTDTGLAPNTSYTYTVMARDKSIGQNATDASSPGASATTDPLDNIAPATPGFDVLPTALSPTEITMTATTVTDPSGVEYYFTETSNHPGGSDSGWQDSPTYTDTGLAPSTSYTYTVKARDKSSGQNTSAASAGQSAITQDIPSGPGGAIIYEPFEDGNATLSGNTPGTGLSGSWTASGAVVAGSLGYGTFPVGIGNQVSINNQYGGITIGPELAAAGLFINGAELWFSVLVQTGGDINTNGDLGFAFGTNRIGSGNNLPLNGTGVQDALGFTFKNNQLRASHWDQNFDGSTTTETLIRSATNSGNGASPNTLYLVVGKFTWGATDTLQIYRPDTNLNLGSPVSTYSTAVDQLLFNTISFGSKGASPAHFFDEIRFGASYDDVIGAGGGGSDYDDWAAGFDGLDVSDPQGDADGDGLTNDEERIWGTDPGSSAHGGPITVQLDPGDGTFSYRRRDDALTGLTYTIWTSTNMVNWNQDTGASQQDGTPGGDGVETVSVTVSQGLLSSLSLFVQVRAE